MASGHGPRLVLTRVDRGRLDSARARSRLPLSPPRVHDDRGQLADARAPRRRDGGVPRGYSGSPHEGVATEREGWASAVDRAIERIHRMREADRASTVRNGVDRDAPFADLRAASSLTCVIAPE